MHGGFVWWHCVKPDYRRLRRYRCLGASRPVWCCPRSLSLGSSLASGSGRRSANVPARPPARSTTTTMNSPASSPHPSPSAPPATPASASPTPASSPTRPAPTWHARRSRENCHHVVDRGQAERGRPSTPPTKRQRHDHDGEARPTARQLIFIIKDETRTVIVLSRPVQGAYKRVTGSPGQVEARPPPSPFVSFELSYAG